MSEFSKPGDLLQTWKSQVKHHSLDIMEVPKSESGLVTYGHARAWEQVATLGKSLESSPCRDRLFLQGLVKMGRRDEARSLSTVILKRSETAQGLTNDSVRLQLILIELDASDNRFSAAECRLDSLKSSITGDAQLETKWALILDLMSAHICILRQDTRKALKQLHSLRMKFSDDAEILVIVLCHTIRLLIIMGCAQTCQTYCNELDVLLQRAPQWKDSKIGHHISLTQGLVYFTLAKYDTAIKIFDNILQTSEAHVQLNSAGTLLQGHNDEESDFFFQDWNMNLYATACVNYAVCCVHLRRINDGMTRLEKMIQINPSVFLTQHVIFNLCTIYDLSCAPELSENKKRALKSLAHDYHQTLDWNVFRIST
jgi:hypothetical protein